MILSFPKGVVAGRARESAIHIAKKVIPKEKGFELGMPRGIVERGEFERKLCSSVDSDERRRRINVCVRGKNNIRGAVI